MNSAAILRDTAAEGVILSLSPTGNIKAVGEQSRVTQWLPTIREHKVELIAALKGGVVQPPPDMHDCGTETVLLTTSEDTSIRRWLADIEESAADTIADVMHRCRTDRGIREYFLGRAREVPVSDDDRRRCTQCMNLRQGVCTVARPAAGVLVVARRGYRPDCTRLRRCERYEPGAGDTDLRSGRERWLGPTQMDACAPTEPLKPIHRKLATTDG